uniref:Uncharacterized protein n=1 Tax=Vitrella brassicaformis TaxID=1169539 RepID=A0A7S1PEG4_9ALVE
MGEAHSSIRHESILCVDECMNQVRGWSGWLFLCLGFARSLSLCVCPHTWMHGTDGWTDVMSVCTYVVWNECSRSVGEGRDALHVCMPQYMHACAPQFVGGWMDGRVAK